MSRYYITKNVEYFILIHLYPRTEGAKKIDFELQCFQFLRIETPEIKLIDLNSENPSLSQQVDKFSSARMKSRRTKVAA